MKLTKNIWIFNQTAGKHNSGWGERHYSLSKYWKNKGYNITIFSGSYNHLFIRQPTNIKRQFNFEKIDENLQFCWIKIPKYDGSSVFKLWSMLVFAFKLFFFKSNIKPDVILVSSMPLFSILPGYYFKRKFNAKLIFEVRDLWPLTPIYLSKYSKWNPIIVFMALVEKLGYKKADKIVSVLPNANKYINKISKSPAKFHYIPNGINQSSDFKKLPNTIKNLLPKNKFLIAYTGTLGLANAMEYFIEASIQLKKNKKVHFLIVGDGYLKEKYIKKTIENENITFIPKIEKKYMQALLSYIDVCYLGRYNLELYNFGVSYNKYFDYMLAAKPILESSKYINSPAQLAKCSLTVKPESATAITKGILKLLKYSPKELANMGEKGREYVLYHHNYEILAAKYENLFL